MVVVNLTEDEIDRCMYWGSAVHGKKNRYSSTKLLAKNKNTHGLGKIGELAFAKFCDLLTVEDIDWNIQTSGDSFDFVVNGFTVDVKTTTYYQKPQLKENYPAPKKQADVYVLCGLDYKKQVAKIAGFISSRKFLVDENISPGKNVNWPNHRKLYILEPKQLCQDWGLLYEFNNKRMG